jgi:hypothetical protein
MRRFFFSGSCRCLRELGGGVSGDSGDAAEVDAVLETDVAGLAPRAAPRVAHLFKEAVFEKSKSPSTEIGNRSVTNKELVINNNPEMNLFRCSYFPQYIKQRLWTATAQRGGCRR